ncbi:MAG: aldo/keto reductase [bacterium]
MDLKRFGKPGIILNRMGFGGWQLGNTAFWGEMEEADGIRLVRAAIDKGINFFDTAPGYANGLSETIIGKAIGSDRHALLISTKFGHKADGTSDWRVEAIEPAIHESLGRLKTTYLDSVILHNPAIDILRGETGHFDELARLKRSGLIRAYGVSIDTKTELETVLDHLYVDVVEILFNVFFQSPRDLYERVKAAGIFLIAKVPLDSGWLSGKYDDQSIFTGIRSRWSREDIQRRARLVRSIKDICGGEDISLPALAFLLSYDTVACLIPGIKTIRQMNDNLAALHYPLPAVQKRALEELYDREIRHNPLPW